MSGRLYATLLGLLFPPKCVFCRKILRKHEKGLCERCSETLPRPDPRTTQGGVYSVCVASLCYSDMVKKAIHRYKFGGRANYAKTFGAIMAESIAKELEGRYDVITWVPISAVRKRARGYDQSMLLAYTIALKLQDVALETLRKTVNNEPQSNLDGAALRRKNVQGAYEVIDPALVRGKRILLVDDIMTTGATLSECAAALLGAGAAEVVCAVLARPNTGSNRVFGY
jgi:competence protein ComFC